MNILLDGLPRSVSVSGRDVPIETGYRTGLKFERVLRDTRLSNADKLRKALGLYFRPGLVRPEEYTAAVEALIGFYRCGAPPAPKEEPGEDGPPEDPIYDYEHDAGYIYAAFMQAYRVDLSKNIHWWQFKALFQSLPSDTMLMKIIGYRTAKVPSTATAEQRQRIEELKRLYALPLDADRQRLKTDLEAILLNGGNPAALLQQEGAERSVWHSTTAP